MAEKVPHPRRCVARRESNYKNVMRPTRWGSPYRIEDDAPATRLRVLARYRKWLDGKLRDDPEFLEPLRGYNLGCTCARELPCHADILLERLYGRGARTR